MCGRFTVVGEDGLAAALDAIETETWTEAAEVAHASERLDRRDARPTARVQVIARDGSLTTMPMIWGFAVSWQRGVVFNARIERAADAGGMWADAFAARRCIVPAWTFFEPHRTETARSARTGRTVKRQYAFEAPDGAPLLLAGIYDRPLEADAVTGATSEAVPVIEHAGTAANGATRSALDDLPRFSIVTTAPTRDVAAVHDRMPLALSPAEAAAWLRGAPAPAFADRSALRLASRPESPAPPSGTSPRSGQGPDQLSLFSLG